MKKAKYSPLAEEAKQRGWRVRIWAVKVGCKCFPAQSLTVLFRDMGCNGREWKMWDVTKEASRAIWRWSSIKENLKGYTREYSWIGWHLLLAPILIAETSRCLMPGG